MKKSRFWDGEEILKTRRKAVRTLAERNVAQSNDMRNREQLEIQSLAKNIQVSIDTLVAGKPYRPNRDLRNFDEDSEDDGEGELHLVGEDDAKSGESSEASSSEAPPAQVQAPKRAFGGAGLPEWLRRSTNFQQTKVKDALVRLQVQEGQPEEDKEEKSEAESLRTDEAAGSDEDSSFDGAMSESSFMNFDTTDINDLAMEQDIDRKGRIIREAEQEIQRILPLFKVHERVQVLEDLNDWFQARLLTAEKEVKAMAELETSSKSSMAERSEGVRSLRHALERKEIKAFTETNRFGKRMQNHIKEHWRKRQIHDIGQAMAAEEDFEAKKAAELLRESTQQCQLRMSGLQDEIAFLKDALKKGQRDLQNQQRFEDTKKKKDVQAAKVLTIIAGQQEEMQSLNAKLVVEKQRLEVIKQATEGAKQFISRNPALPPAKSTMQRLNRNDDNPVERLLIEVELKFKQNLLAEKMSADNDLSELVWVAIGLDAEENQGKKGKKKPKTGYVKLNNLFAEDDSLVQQQDARREEILKASGLQLPPEDETTYVSTQVDEGPEENRRKLKVMNVQCQLLQEEIEVLQGFRRPRRGSNANLDDLAEAHHDHAVHRAEGAQEETHAKKSSKKRKAKKERDDEVNLQKLLEKTTSAVDALAAKKDAFIRKKHDQGQSESDTQAPAEGTGDEAAPAARNSMRRSTRRRTTRKGSIVVPQAATKEQLLFTLDILDGNRFGLKQDLADMSLEAMQLKSEIMRVKAENMQKENERRLKESEKGKHRSMKEMMARRKRMSALVVTRTGTQENGILNFVEEPDEPVSPLYASNQEYMDGASVPSPKSKKKSKRFMQVEKVKQPKKVLEQINKENEDSERLLKDLQKQVAELKPPEAEEQAATEVKAPAARMGGLLGAMKSANTAPAAGAADQAGGAPAAAGPPLVLPKKNRFLAALGGQQEGAPAAEAAPVADGKAADGGPPLVMPKKNRFLAALGGNKGGDAANAEVESKTAEDKHGKDNPKDSKEDQEEKDKKAKVKDLLQAIEGMQSEKEKLEKDLKQLEEKLKLAKNLDAGGIVDLLKKDVHGEKKEESQKIKDLRVEAKKRQSQVSELRRTWQTSMTGVGNKRTGDRQTNQVKAAEVVKKFGSVLDKLRAKIADPVPTEQKVANKLMAALKQGKEGEGEETGKAARSSILAGKSSVNSLLGKLSERKVSIMERRPSPTPNAPGGSGVPTSSQATPGDRRNTIHSDSVEDGSEGSSEDTPERRKTFFAGMVSKSLRAPSLPSTTEEGVKTDAEPSGEAKPKEEDDDEPGALPVASEPRRSEHAAEFQNLMGNMMSGRRASVTMPRRPSQAVASSSADGEEAASSTAMGNPMLRRSLQAATRRHSSIFQLIGKAKHISDDDESDADPEKPGAKATSTVRFSLKPEEVPVEILQDQIIEADEEDAESSDSESSGSEEVNL